MTAPKLTKEFFINRRQELLKLLPENSTVFVVSADQLPRNGDQFYPYRQNSDLFYLTGITQEQTILVLCPNHPKEKYRQVLFIRRSSKKIERWEGYKLTKDQAKQISGIEQIYWTDEFETYLPEFMFYADNVFISTNENMKYLRFYNDAEYRFIDRLKFLYPLHNYKRLAPLLIQLRLKKQPEELAVIKYAIDLTAKAFERVLNFTRPGIYEYQVEAEIIHYFWQKGIRTTAYQSIVASGKNATVLHYIENNSLCQDGDLLLLDFGAEYLNYAADLTRTIPVNGKFTLRQKEVYNAVLEVQRFMIEQYIKPGLTINQITDKSRQLIGEKLVQLGLLKESEAKDEEKIKEFYPHGLSHFMGLDVHDVGTKDIPLEPGMIITVEPGIYIDKEGIGVRIENDVLITKNGTEDLMRHIPVLPEQIEKEMKK